MEKDEFKQKIKKFSKEEIIEALCEQFMFDRYYFDILQKAKDIKFNTLMDKDKNIRDEMGLLLERNSDTVNQKLHKRKKFIELMEKSNKLQKQIDSILNL